ncbi:Ankyrin repeats (3 copies) [Phycisphaerae bacterium RAS1]|nr:Ankyrin repeats (3 copies) [Phycisphaerae bacterium RAS1]
MGGSNSEGDEQTMTVLRQAVMKNDVAAVRQFIAAGGDVNAWDDQGWTALHAWALRDGHPEMLRVLLSAGADTNARNREGFTPLHVAVIGDNIKAITLLLKEGADVNASDPATKTTPLHIAALAAKPPLIRTLLAAGADLSARDSTLLRPLDHATLNCAGKELLREASRRGWKGLGWH